MRFNLSLLAGKTASSSVKAGSDGTLSAISQVAQAIPVGSTAVAVVAGFALGVAAVTASKYVRQDKAKRLA